MTYVAFAVGLLAGSVLFLTALRKILEPERAVARAWKPDYVRGATAKAAIAIVGTVEAIVAVVAFVPIVPPPAAITAIAILASGVTAYGVLALKNLGTCGCGSALPDVLTKRALFGRNAILFGGLTVGAAVGPSMNALESDAAGYSLSAILALYVVVVGAMVVRSRWRAAPPGPSGTASSTAGDV